MLVIDCFQEACEKSNHERDNMSKGIEECNNNCIMETLWKRAYSQR